MEKGDIVEFWITFGKKKVKLIGLIQGFHNNRVIVQTGYGMYSKTHNIEPNKLTVITEGKSAQIELPL